MAQTTEELKQAQSEAMKSMGAAAQTALAGFQKLATLNLESAKASIDTASDQVRALLAAQDVKAVTDLVTSFTKPGAEKFVAYARAVYASTSETSTGLAEAVRAQVEKGNQQLVAQVQELAKNAPGGAEGAVSFVKEAMTVASSTYDQLHAATRRFVDAGAASVSAAAEKTAHS
jgi:phasin family protein